MIDLVIPDIHNRVDLVENILAKEAWDRCTLLGDYFDFFWGSKASNLHSTMVKGSAT